MNNDEKERVVIREVHKMTNWIKSLTDDEIKTFGTWKGFNAKGENHGKESEDAQ